MLFFSSIAAPGDVGRRAHVPQQAQCDVAPRGRGLICSTDGGREHRPVPPIVKRARGAIDSYCQRTTVRGRRVPPPPPLPIPAATALHYDAAHAAHVVRYGSTGPGKERGNVTAAGHPAADEYNNGRRSSVHECRSKYSLATPTSTFDHCF